MAKEDAVGDLIDLVMDELKTNGVSTAKVSDGRLMLFRRDFLERMLASNPDKQEFHILIKDRGFEN
jgi:hypothetical protein